MEHGDLSLRLVEIDRLDKALMELQQDLMGMGTQIKKTAPKRKSNKTEPLFPSKDIIGAIVAELENCSCSISTTYKNAHQTQEHTEYLDYTIRVTKNYIEDICKKNRSSLQNEAVKKALERSNYAIRPKQIKILNQ